VLTVLARGRAGLRLNVRQLWPDLRLLRRLLRVSLPAGLDSLTVAVGQLWFLSVVNRLSADESGAHGIALRCEALSFLTGTAFGTAAMTLVGQNLGAGRRDRAARDTWTAFGLSCLVMCLCGVVFFTLAPQMFALFCPYKDQQGMIAAGGPVLRLIAFAMPPLACTIVFTAALRGAGGTRVPGLFTPGGVFLIRIPPAPPPAGDPRKPRPLGVRPGAHKGPVGPQDGDDRGVAGDVRRRVRPRSILPVPLRQRPLEAHRGMRTKSQIPSPNRRQTRLVSELGFGICFQPSSQKTVLQREHWPSR